ncbi:MAG: nitroreductase family protein [Bacteroidales bacterium]|nr:nitroreductase family protein [Bacteroidales bacterium]MBN2632565.1 nitroreductase family protein [Bacteroidales bacterium]
MALIDGKTLLELISTRQSDRKYSPSPVEQEKIDRITEAARLAPSACNGQPWKFIVVNDPGLLKKLASAAGARILKMNMFVDQAPVMIVVVREKTNLSSGMGALVKSKDYSLIDIGIAAGNICMQAEAEGLGSCIIGWFDENEVRKILSIPRSKRVELIITIGYPETAQRMKTRKPKDETVSYNKY